MAKRRNRTAGLPPVLWQGQAENLGQPVGCLQNEFAQWNLMEKTWRQQYKCGLEWRMFFVTDQAHWISSSSIGKKYVHMLGFFSPHGWQCLCIMSLHWYCMQFVAAEMIKGYSLDKKATFHQLTTVLSTSKNVLFPGHDHLPTTCAEDLSL